MSSTEETPQQPILTKYDFSAYEGRVPIGMKLFYAVGASAETIIGVAFNAFNFFFYTNLLGLSGTLAGLAITIGLFVDAITDPLIGAISDQWLSKKFGRRHPFMFTAPIPVMACLFFIYSPPASLGDWGLFFWLTGLVVTMRASMTMFHVPHLAMGAELSSDFTERTRVMAINTLFGALTGAGTYFIALSVFFTPTPGFENGLLDRSSYPAFAVTASLTGGAIMLFSAFYTMKLVPYLPQPAHDRKSFTMMQFFRDVKGALNNYNYRFLLIGYVLLSATLGTRDTIGLHMNTYFWELVPGQIRFFAVAPLMGPVIAFLVAAKLHAKFDKKPTIIGGLILLCTFAAAPVILRISGFFPANHTPWLFPTLLIMATLAMISGAILLISVMSALADVADDHELNTGRRQEGIFYASRSFFAKASSGLGHLIAGVALDVINFPEGAEPGTIDPEIIFRLGLVDGPIAIIPGFIAVIFYLKYNLTRDRHAEIQAELRERYAEKRLAGT